MTETTPTFDQRVLLDVLGNIPAGWDYEVTYPSHSTVNHRFREFPQLVLTESSGGETRTVAVRAVITDEPLFHGYTVTTTSPEPGLVVQDCRERRLTSLSHDELAADGVSLTHHAGADPSSQFAAEQSLSLSAAARLAAYYAETVSTDSVTVDAATPSIASATDD